MLPTSGAQKRKNIPMSQSDRKQIIFRVLPAFWTSAKVKTGENLDAYAWNNERKSQPVS